MAIGLCEALQETDQQCSLPAALEVMGERWSFLILRAAFSGLQHFEEFQSELGIARNILANRLSRLVGHGILERHALPEDRRKIEYRMTEKGFALLAPLVALRQWGERWETGVPPSLMLADARDLKPIAQIAVTSHDGRILGKDDIVWAVRDEDA